MRNIIFVTAYGWSVRVKSQRYQLGVCQSNLDIKDETMEIERDGQDQRKKTSKFHSGLDVLKHPSSYKWHHSAQILENAGVAAQ